MHDVGVARDRARLVGLQLADEVPPQRQVLARRGLGGCLLVTVLSHVTHPECRQASYVLRRPGLGHRDDVHLLARAPGGGARGPDPAFQRREPPGQLPAALVLGHPGLSHRR